MTPTCEILLRDAAWLRGLARRLVGPVDRADDLVQDVSLAALRAPAQRAIGRPWLATVAGNLSRLVHRRSRREYERLQRLAVPAAAPSPAELVEQAELQQRAVAAVLALAPDYRDTVLLRFLQGLSLEQTAARLRLPLETVRTRQRRALAMLREQLVPPGGGEHAGKALAIVGWIMKTKAVAGVLVGALVLVGAFWLFESTPPLEPVVAPVADARPAAPAPATGAAATSPAPGETREPASLPQPPAAAEAAKPRAAAPVATLTVRVRWRDDESPAPGVSVMCRPQVGVGPIATADAAGVAKFEELAPGKYAVCAADMTSTNVVLAANVPEQIDLLVDRGFAVRGRVVDPDGAPVPYADVVVRHGVLQPAFVFLAGRADAQGRFRIESISGDMTIGAQHAQFGTTDFELLRKPEGEANELVLTMPRAGFAAVTGRVTDDQGRPIANAWVHLQQGGVVQIRPGARYVLPPPPAISATDAEGRFAAVTLRPGARRLYVYFEGFAPHVEKLELGAGERREVAVVLRAGASLQCTVRGPDGKVVLGANVSVAGLEYPQRGHSRVAGSNAVRFTDLPSGPCKLSVYDERFARCERTIDLTAGQTATIDIELTHGPTVRGILLDEQRRPLAHWWVDLGFAKRRVATDAAGRFVLPECAAMGNTLQFRPGTGMPPVAMRVAGVDADGPERTFVLGPEFAPSARVRGRCLAVDGTPLGGVAVGLFQEHQHVDGRVVTAADGSFEIGPLPPGPYRVYPTHRDAQYQGIDFEVKANEVRELPPFAAKPPR